MSNLFWGMQFTRRFAFVKRRISLFSCHCEANHRFAKAIQIFCDSKNDKNQSARSANLCKSFCFVWLLPNEESPLPLNFNLSIVQGKQIVGDLQGAKMDSLRCRAQNDESGVDFHESQGKSRNNAVFKAFLI